MYQNKYSSLGALQLSHSTLNRYHLEDDDVLVYLHIPKTAGTSFVHILKQHFEENKIMQQPFMTLPKVDAESLAGYDLISGHFTYDILKFISRPHFIITMLRHPIDRVLSYYGFVREMPKNPVHEYANEFPFDQFIDLPHKAIRWHVYNQMTAMLSNITMWDEPPTEDDLQLAKQNLQEMAFVGMTEFFDESVRLLNYTFHWHDNASQIPRHNITRNRQQRAQVAPNVLERLAKYNQLDLELHQFAVGLFRQRYQQMVDELMIADQIYTHGYQQVVEQLQQANKHNKEQKRWFDIRFRQLEESTMDVEVPLQKFNLMQEQSTEDFVKNRIRLDEEDVLVFIHIPKTAGSSFIQVLQENFEHIANLPPISMIESQADLEALSGGSRILVGHVTNCIERYLPKKPLYITMLRHPVERTISAYYHTQRDEDNLFHQLACKQDLENFLKNQQVRNYYENLMARHIAADYPWQELSQHVDIIKQRIEQMPFVGITEYFEQSILLLHHRFGWQYHDHLPKLNIGNTPSRNQFPQHVIDAILEMNQVDLEIYHFAKQRFMLNYQQMLFDLFTTEHPSSATDAIIHALRIIYRQLVPLRARLFLRNLRTGNLSAG
ncbi:MAG: hypothetical protein CUN54_05900 [Phototrophicales bacterium]|nr:MAG: hypothetical protein CUN54_05900 [Phototrophicales bacterium]